MNEQTSAIFQASPAASRNPVRSGADWRAMRAACLADPGSFHGDIAAEAMHWFVGDFGAAGAWLSRGEDGVWRGWDAATAAPVDAALPADFTPWRQAFDASEPPHWRWFVGGRTNACFSEVDRHVLAGHGDEAALIFEGDRWDMSAGGGQGAPVDCSSAAMYCTSLPSQWMMSKSFHATGVLPGPFSCLIFRSPFVHSTLAVFVSTHAVPFVPK